MRNLFVLLFLTICSFGSFAQSGVYVIDHTYDRSDDTKTKWTLTLNKDSTFLYHFLRDISGEANPEENFYGKGTWIAEKNIIFFYTDKETDLDELYTINFINSKARYITKLLRDKSNKVVKTALRFYDSDLSYIKDLQLFKE